MSTFWLHLATRTSLSFVKFTQVTKVCVCVGGGIELTSASTSLLIIVSKVSCL